MTDDVQFLTKQSWETIGVRHHHGICVPLMSLHSKNSGGIGEYLDLIPLISWLKTTGFDTLQLLPINDTGTEISPYMGISGCALHPIYLSLKNLPFAEKVPQLRSFHELAQQSSSKTHVDYEKVLSIKEKALRLYVKKTLPLIKESKDFIAFVEDQKIWLTPYSIFKALKTAHTNKPFWEWKMQDPHAFSTTDAALLEEIAYWRVIQFLCFSQMQEVRKAATENSIFLKGDIPILISKDSADVWWNPELFSLKEEVGAPPDMYNKNGQAWGFPLYNWKAHEKNGYLWWKNRLHVAERLYDLFRLDHLVGFYRFYSIPSGKSGEHGTFIPKEPSAWISQGEQILQNLVQSTSMLPLAEDLGDVPSEVRASMHRLGIPGLKVLRWEKNYGSDESYILPTRFSPESVSTVSTHDSSTQAQFWKEEQDSAKQMADAYGFPFQESYTSELGIKLLEISHRSGSLFHINLFVEYLRLFPDLSSPDLSHDRLNVPGTISSSNWVKRFYVPLEQICSHKNLLQTMKEFSAAS